MTALAMAGAVLLDACRVLNLYASRRMQEILAAIPVRWGVAEAALAEAVYVRRGGVGDDADEHDSVDLTDLIGAGTLEVVRPETPEGWQHYLAFASHLDDGEAMTCALAAVRGYTVASDDRKVRSVRAKLTIAVVAHSTTYIMKTWAESTDMPTPDLRQCFIDIRDRARFVPGRHDPLQQWWDAIVSG